MFGIGFLELTVIAVVALLFVGPKKLPDLMRQAGRFFVQIRRMSSDVRSSVDQVIRDAEADIRREEREAMQKLLAVETEAKEKDPEEELSKAAHAEAHPEGSEAFMHGVEAHESDTPAKIQPEPKTES